MSSYNSRFLRLLCKLGVANGFLFGTLTEMIFFVIYKYERYSSELTRLDPTTHIDMAPFPFPWWLFPLLSPAFVVLACFLVYRFLAPYIKSTIILWQAIGLVAVFEGYLLTFCRDWWEATFSSLGADYWEIAYSKKLILWLLLLSFASVFNLLYGAIIRHLYLRENY